jgi:GNAT superfamily N-acetyltransferase
VPKIATLRRDQIGDSSAVLTRAFDDDPVFRYLYPTARRRRWACRRFLQAIVRDGLPFGEVWAAVDDGTVIGAAGWLPEGAYPPSRRRAARQLVAAWQALLTPHTFRDGLRYLTETEKLHPKEPHWYLAVLGTDTAHQGKGIGSALMAPILAKCDEEGLPAYLESSKESNVPFYKRHGFEVTGEVTAKDGPTLWPMYREPRVPEL